ARTGRVGGFSRDPRDTYGRGVVWVQQRSAILPQLTITAVVDWRAARSPPGESGRGPPRPGARPPAERPGRTDPASRRRAPPSARDPRRAPPRPRGARVSIAPG